MAKQRYRPVSMTWIQYGAVLQTISGVNPLFARFFAILYAAVLLIFVGLLQTTGVTLLQKLFGEQKPQEALTWSDSIGLLPFLVFITLTVFCVKRITNRLRGKAEATEIIVPHSGIIITLSNIDKNIVADTEEALSERDPGIALQSLFGSIRHPWRQPCKGLAVHGNALRWVGLVVSKESSEQANLFIRVANAYLELSSKQVQFESSKPVDIAKAEEVMSGIQDFLDSAQKTIPLSEIAIDVTGGTKTATVAGVMAAMSRSEPITLQYVDTNDSKVYEVAYRAFLAQQNNA